jgi:hypothetical protein
MDVEQNAPMHRRAQNDEQVFQAFFYPRVHDVRARGEEKVEPAPWPRNRLAISLTRPPDFGVRHMPGIFEILRYATHAAATT